MKTIMVTGCLGTIGIFTVNKLLSKGYEVIGVDNCSTNPYQRITEINPSSNFHFVNNRIYDNKEYSILEKTFENYHIDAIIHLASRVGAAESFYLYKEYIDSNITFTMELLTNAVKHNIKRFVFASSSSVYGDSEVPSHEDLVPSPASLYGVSKYMCELLLKQYHDNFGLETIALRYYNTFAPIKYYGYKTVVTLFSNKILNDEPITIYNMGRQRRQYIHVDNVVHANILALETQNEQCFGQAFNVTVDEPPINLLELVELLYKYLNKKPNYILKEEKALGDIDLFFGSTEKAKKYLGYSVQVPMIEGIKQYCDYVVNNHV
jgi:UDP-glucose 4-epimerase